MRGTAHVVRLQDRGGRNAMAAARSCQRFALRNDDRRAAIPAPRLRGRRLDLRGGLARLHRAGDLLARGLLIGADAGTAAIGRRGGDRPARLARAAEARTSRPCASGAGWVRTEPVTSFEPALRICGLRLIGPRAFAETRRIAATAGEPGGQAPPSAQNRTRRASATARHRRTWITHSVRNRTE